jgi:hypothetical protein
LIDDASDESPKIGITRNSIAALFVKYGYDVGGFMPYEVFVSALLAAPSRLRGMELSMDTGAKVRVCWLSQIPPPRFCRPSLTTRPS